MLTRKFPRTPPANSRPGQNAVHKTTRNPPRAEKDEGECEKDGIPAFLRAQARQSTVPGGRQLTDATVVRCRDVQKPEIRREQT